MELLNKAEDIDAHASSGDLQDLQSRIRAEKEHIAAGFSPATFRKLVKINKDWGLGSGLEECTEEEANYLRLRRSASKAR